MNTKENSLNWFEIPANDIARARKFYDTIFDITMADPMNEMPGMEMAFFPWEAGSGKATGALVKSDQHTPSAEGTIVYLNANPNMDPVIARVEAAGGSVSAPKMSIGEHGHIAFIMDTEGNKIGLHSEA
jgi:predicted enzyme related to lactoylglutathione lyase